MTGLIVQGIIVSSCFKFRKATFPLTRRAPRQLDEPVRADDVERVVGAVASRPRAGPLPLL